MIIASLSKLLTATLAGLFFIASTVVADTSAQDDEKTQISLAKFREIGRYQNEMKGFVHGAVSMAVKADHLNSNARELVCSALSQVISAQKTIIFAKHNREFNDIWFGSAYEIVYTTVNEELKYIYPLCDPSKYIGLTPINLT